MAQVRLGRFEAEKKQLPPICMRCGAVATVWKEREFTWYPSWVSLFIFVFFIPYVVLVRVLGQKLKASVPLCDRHRYHWLWRSILVPGSLVGLFFCSCGVPMGLNITFGKNTVPEPLVNGFLISFPVGLIVWFVMTLVLQTTAIHPTEITENSITLDRVADAFADAVGRQRAAAVPEVIPVEDVRRRPGGQAGGDQYFDPRRR